MIAYWDRNFEWMGESLVGHWCFSFTGSTERTTLDLSGYGNHARNLNMGIGNWQTVDGQTAMGFDGVDDQVSATTWPQRLLADYNTVMIWAKRPSFANQEFFICTGSASFGSMYSLTTNYQNLEFRYGAASPVSSLLGNTEYANRWIHLCGVTEPGLARIFIDGVERARSTNSFTTTKTETGLGIGFRIGIGGSSSGFLDDARIYARTVSPAQILATAQAGRAGGMLHQPPRRRSVSIAAGFKAYWFRNQQRMIGGGIR